MDSLNSSKEMNQTNMFESFLWISIYLNKSSEMFEFDFGIDYLKWIFHKN